MIAWMDDGACRGKGKLFFPQTLPSTGNPDTNHDYGPARKLCAECPVREKCLDWALAWDENFGMWGGMTPSERQKEVARRMRKFGRKQRKDAGIPRQDALSAAQRIEEAERRMMGP